MKSSIWRYFVAVILKVLFVNLLAALNFANVFKNKKTSGKLKKNLKNVKKVFHIFVVYRTLYALVSRLCLTRLSAVAMPYSDMWQDCQSTLQHTSYAKSSYRSVDPQTLHGNVHQVDHVPNGPTNSAAMTTMFPLRLCGGKPLVAVTRERRYGPSRLRVNDDDDDHDGIENRLTGSMSRRA